MEKITENMLLESVKRGLDYSVGNLDSQTQAHLTRIRLQALERNNRSSMFFHIPSFSHGFAAAAVATLFVTLWVLPNAKDSSPTQAAPAVSMLMDSGQKAAPMTLDQEAMDVLMSSEDVDFLENMDIYEWLVAEYG